MPQLEALLVPLTPTGSCKNIHFREQPQLATWVHLFGASTLFSTVAAQHARHDRYVMDTYYVHNSCKYRFVTGR